MRPLRRVPRIGRNERGMAVTEFALVAPVLCILLLGALDMSHSLYMQSVLQGVVQKTARDSTLESGTETAKQAALDANVVTNVRKLAKNATVTITRRYFKDFTKAAQAAAEPFTDTTTGIFHDGICNNGEPYQDSNNNGVWDKDGGDDGQGGAKDDVVYTVVISYPRMFRFGFLGLPPTTTVTATTVLANQPYGDQSQYGAPVARNCT